MKPFFLLLDAPVRVATPSQLGRRDRGKEILAVIWSFLTMSVTLGLYPASPQGSGGGCRGRGELLGRGQAVCF